MNIERWTMKKDQPMSKANELMINKQWTINHERLMMNNEQG